MIKFSATILALLLSFDLFAFPPTPNPNVTTGELCSEEDPDFTTHRYQESIPYCQRNVSMYRRQQIYDLYQIPEKCRSRYTIDHFVPLAIGGNNADSNLWPEHVLVKSTRPRLEIELYYAMTRGDITQDEAIRIITQEKMSNKQSLQAFQRRTPADCDRP